MAGGTGFEVGRPEPAACGQGVAERGSLRHSRAVDRPASPDPAEVERVARCCCGKLSIRVVGDPVLSGVCHCDDCHRRTGSAFGWSAYFPLDRVKAIKGKAKTYAPAAGTGTRHFCRHCGSTVYWSANGLPDMLGVAGGGFAETPLPPPAHSYRDSKRCAWLDLPEDWERKL
jgi:hypothetical protein